MTSDGDVRSPLSDRPAIRSVTALIPLLIVGCAILVAVGSIGPWASVLFVTADGTEGDGTMTLFLGIGAGIGALISLVRPRYSRILVVSALLFAVAAGIGIYDWNNLDSIVTINDFQIPFIEVQVRWGLVVMTLAACAGTVLSLVGMVVLRTSPPSQNPATPPA